MGLDNLDQNYHDPNFEGDNHPWGDNKDYQKWEDYNKLLKSGMFWEFHPELSGEWEKDKDEFIKYHKELKDNLNKNKSLLSEETHVKLTKTLNQDKIDDLKEKIKIDQKHLQDMMKYTEENNPPKEERVIKAFRGCVNSSGFVDALFDCGDIDCPGCTMIRDAFQKKIDRQFGHLNK